MTAKDDIVGPKAGAANANDTHKDTAYGRLSREYWVVHKQLPPKAANHVDSYHILHRCASISQAWTTKKAREETKNHQSSIVADKSGWNRKD